MEEDLKIVRAEKYKNEEKLTNYKLKSIGHVKKLTRKETRTWNLMKTTKDVKKTLQN